jgi:hypothetical protein
VAAQFIGAATPDDIAVISSAGFREDELRNDRLEL